MNWMPPEPGPTSREVEQRIAYAREHPEQFAPAERPAPLHGWARVVIWLLLATAALSVLSLLSELDLHSFLIDVRNGVPRTLSDAAAIDNRRQLVSGLQLLALLATAVAFIGWFRRGYRNLPALGRRDLRFVRGWAIWSWMVPFLNLARPKQIANDIWRGSGDDVPGRHWTEAPVPALLHWWWAVWLISGIIGSRSARLFFGADTLSDKINASTLSAVDDALSVVAAILAVLVVRALTRRQDATIARRADYAPPAAVAGEAAL